MIKTLDEKFKNGWNIGEVNISIDKNAPKISSSCLMATIAKNLDNDKLTDTDFRQFIRNAITLVKDEIVEEIIAGEK